MNNAEVGAQRVSYEDLLTFVQQFGVKWVFVAFWAVLAVFYITNVAMVYAFVALILAFLVYGFGASWVPRLQTGI